jgi:hypothetical protein
MDISTNSEPSNASAASSPQVSDTDEISLIDILKFLKRQSKIITSVTIAALLLGLVTGLGKTPQARRELLLQWTLPPELIVSPTSAESGSPISPPEIIDEVIFRDEMIAVGNLALQQSLAAQQDSTALPAPISANLSLVVAEQPERLLLVLSSPDVATLSAADQPTFAILQEAADSLLEPYIIPEITRLDLVIQRTQTKITQLETLLASPAANEDNGSALVSSALQLPQQTVLAEELSKLLDYELAQADLTDLQTREAPLIHFEVLRDRQTQASSSFLQRLVLFAIAGFMFGLLIALLIDQIPHIRSALANADD